MQPSSRKGAGRNLLRIYVLSGRGYLREVDGDNLKWRKVPQASFSCTGHDLKAKLYWRIFISLVLFRLRTRKKMIYSSFWTFSAIKGQWRTSPRVLFGRNAFYLGKCSSLPLFTATISRTMYFCFHRRPSFLLINKAQNASSYEECVIDTSSHAYFKAISAFSGKSEKIPPVIVLICHN